MSAIVNELTPVPLSRPAGMKSNEDNFFNSACRAGVAFLMEDTGEPSLKALEDQKCYLELNPLHSIFSPLSSLMMRVLKVMFALFHLKLGSCIDGRLSSVSPNKSPQTIQHLTVAEAESRPRWNPISGPAAPAKK